MVMNVCIILNQPHQFCILKFVTVDYSEVQEVFKITTEIRQQKTEKKNVLSLHIKYNIIKLSASLD